MKRVTVIRISKESLCTRGVILIDDEPIAVSMEPPWLNNQKNISCIPTGIYKAVRRTASPNLTALIAQTFLVENVPNRDGILFHVGNWPANSEGCILVGTGYGKSMVDGPMITNSRDAFTRFMTVLLGDDEIDLNIREVDYGSIQAKETKTPGAARVAPRTVNKKN